MAAMALSLPNHNTCAICRGEYSCAGDRLTAVRPCRQIQFRDNCSTRIRTQLSGSVLLLLLGAHEAVN